MPAPKGHPPYPGCGAPRMYTKEKLAEFAESILEYADKPTSLTLRGWAAEQKRGERWMNNIVESEKTLVSQEGGERKFLDAQNAALAIIGVRREEMALRGEFKGDTGIIKASLATYDMRQRAMMKEMKQAEKETPQDPIVVKIVNYSDAKIEEKSSGEG